MLLLGYTDIDPNLTNIAYSISWTFVLTLLTFKIHAHTLYLHTIPLAGCIENAIPLCVFIGFQVNPAGWFLGLYSVTVVLNSVPAR